MNELAFFSFLWFAPANNTEMMNSLKKRIDWWPRWRYVMYSREHNSWLHMLSSLKVVLNLNGKMNWWVKCCNLPWALKYFIFSSVTCWFVDYRLDNTHYTDIHEHASKKKDKREKKINIIFFNLFIKWQHHCNL